MGTSGRCEVRVEGETEMMGEVRAMGEEEERKGKCR